MYTLDFFLTFDLFSKKTANSVLLSFCEQTVGIEEEVAAMFFFRYWGKTYLWPIKFTPLKQTTRHILMIRPAHFGFNTETAGNNAFQSNDNSQTQTEVKALAVREFDTLVSRLTEYGIEVAVVEDTLDPPKPDAVFPNNWITTHESGILITYPMYAPIRRLERRPKLVDRIMDAFEVQATFDLSHYEDEERFLEGTGSLILDRVNKMAYACVSPRTDEGIMDQFCRLTGYRKVLFHAVDDNGQDIYHTNVMMAMGDNFVVICQESIKDARESALLAHHFERTNKEVISLSMEQVQAFAGNMLQVEGANGDTYLVMSESAYRSLDSRQIRQIENLTNIIYSPIPTIEKYGGGSVRCMMAELFLNKR